MNSAQDCVVFGSDGICTKGKDIRWIHRLNVAIMSLPDTDPQKYHLRIPRLLEVQRRIAANVSLADSFSTDFVAGVDQAFLGELIISGAVLLNVADRVIARASSAMKAAFPYVPGLLSFREGPAAIRAVKELRPKPTLLFVDGCGINHPRRAGLASFIGIMLDLPTIGISKRVLCGEGEQVGHLLKSKDGCRPIVVAPGHRVSMQSSLDLARRYIGGGKLPEPCRLAHEHANLVKRDLTGRY